MFRLALTSSLLLLAVLGVQSAFAQQPPRTLEAARAIEFIRASQQPDGGFGPLGQTLDAVFALRSAGIAPGSVEADGANPEQYLLANIADATGTASIAAKSALGAAAMDLDPRNMDGVDLIAAIEVSFDAETGLYASDAFNQSVAIVGLACTGNTVPDQALEALENMANEDGGWGFDGFSDPDTTAIAIQALATAGAVDTPALQAGVAMIQATQLEDGGWGFGESNTSSTSYVIQALIAVGHNPDGPEYRAATSVPLDYIASQQGPDGSFSGFDRAFSTNQAVPALLGRTFCDSPATVLGSVSLEDPVPPSTGAGLHSPNAGDRLGLLLALGVLLATLGGSGLIAKLR